MSTSVDIHFLDFSLPINLARLQHTFEVFIDTGFQIEEITIASRDFEWSEDEDIAIALLTYALEEKDFHFRAWQPKWKLEIRQYFVWGSNKLGAERRAWINTTTDNTPYFRQVHPDSNKYSEMYLDLGKAIYATIHPSFGWIDYYSGLRTSHEDLEALRLPTMYWATFFGQSYVDKLGKDKILNAPCWKTEELDDGGVLCLLGSSPGQASAQTDYAKLIEYFNGT